MPNPQLQPVNNTSSALGPESDLLPPLPDRDLEKRQNAGRSILVIMLWVLNAALFTIIGAYGFAYLQRLQPVPLASCKYNGSEYAHEDKFEDRDGCNTCFCDDGNIVCTDIACPSGNADDENSAETTPTPELQTLLKFGVCNNTGGDAAWTIQIAGVTVGTIESSDNDSRVCQKDDYQLDREEITITITRSTDSANSVQTVMVNLKETPFVYAVHTEGGLAIRTFDSLPKADQLE